MSLSSPVLKIFVFLALIASASALGFFTLIDRLPPVKATLVKLSDHPPFRSWNEHNEIYGQIEFPYIVEINRSYGAILYIGVLHSDDPDHVQWDVLRKAWKEFRPTVALNEGRARYFRWSNSTLGGINDPKLAYLLARDDDIPIYSLEPSYQTEVDALIEEWPPELVACYLSLRVIVSEAGGQADHAESIAASLIAKRTNADGLRGVLSGTAGLDSVWDRHVPEGPDWRSLTNIDSIELMRQIGDDSREVRGRHMVRSLFTLAREGERVVAVVGASHVIRHEPTLKSLLSRN